MVHMAHTSGGKLQEWRLLPRTTFNHNGLASKEGLLPRIN